MAAFTISWLVFGFASPFIGKIIDRYGVKRPIIVGAIVSGLGFVILNMMSTLWHFYVGWALVGIGTAALGPIPATTIVSNWFETRRGMALGVMATGLGAGGLVLAPLIGGYLIPSFGWRASYLALALLIWALIIPLALFVIKTKPADIEPYHRGLKAAESVSVNQAPPLIVEGLTLRRALGTSALWLIGISFLSSAFGLTGTVQNQVPHLQDIGFPVATAASALGTTGLGSLLGKLIFGWLSDRLPPKYTWCLAVTLQLAATIILINIRPSSSPAMIWAYAILIGLGMGGWLPCMTMLSISLFGLTSYGAIYGMLTLLQSVGTSTGPLLGGFLYDAMNTYSWAFIIFTMLMATAIVTILVTRRPKTPYNFRG